MFVAWLLCFWLPALVFLHITMDGSPATYHCLGTRYYDLYGIMIPLATPRDALCLSQLLQQSVVDLASLSTTLQNKSPHGIPWMHPSTTNDSRVAYRSASTSTEESSSMIIGMVDLESNGHIDSSCIFIPTAALVAGCRLGCWKFYKIPLAFDTVDMYMRRRVMFSTSVICDAAKARLRQEPSPFGIIAW